MTEIKLTFSVPHSLRPKLRAVRLVVDHLLDTLGVSRWRWEFSDGVTKEIIWGPFSESFAEAFHVPTGQSSKTPIGFDFGEQ